MRTKNHIKADLDELRGMGKLGWTESGKMHSTIKKLTGTFDEGSGVPHISTKVNKITVTCPLCKAKFKTNKGKIPKHKLQVRSYIPYKKDDHGYCMGDRYMSKPVFRILDTLKSIEIKDVNYTAGDKVIIDTTGWYDIKSFAKNTVIEVFIENIVEGRYAHYIDELDKDFPDDRDKYFFFKFVGVDEYIRTWGFHTSNLQKIV